MKEKASLPVAPFDSGRLFGSVCQVGLGSIQVVVHGAASRVNSAEPAVDGGVGDYVVVACSDLLVVGQLVDMRLKEASTPAPIAAVELFASMHLVTGAVSSGVIRTPRLGAQVFMAHPKLVQMIVAGRARAKGKKQIALNIACLPDATHTPLEFTPDSLFGRHLAVLGTTGAGKSWTIGRLLEEVAAYNSKVVLFDASGEFDGLPPGSRNVYLGQDPNPPPGMIQAAVPYFELRESDLYAIFKPAGQSQFPKLRMAIKSLKLARLCPHLALDGTIIKAHRSKLDYDNEYRRFSPELESPTADFEIALLAKQIENECVNPQRSPTEGTTWGGPNGADYSDCVPLINRIQDIVYSPNLAPIFHPGDLPSLFTEIRQFLTDDSAHILRISLRYLSFDHNAREIIANAIGRHLLEIARTGFFRQQPLLVVLDEAHQFLNSALLTGDHFPLDAFGLIAKEGRKYALNLCLSTQRPRDIPEGVLSQIGTLIVHRLINDLDRQLIERACSIDKTTAASLPVLAPGDAIVLGVDFPVPLAVKIQPPKGRPDSRGPEFQKYW